MKILHYDCFAGISGDMNLAALLDAGLDFNLLVSELKKLKLPDDWKIEVGQNSRGGIVGTQIKVIYDEHHHHNEEEEHKHEHHHRTFYDIKRIIEDSALTYSAKNRAIKIFQTLAEAEAKAHNQPIEKVHFHEVGAIDSIIDIIGCAIAIDLLEIGKITSSEVELGGGKVHCAHGIMDVPAPATANLAEKFPHRIGGANHECTTPTGAAIIASLVEEFNPKSHGKFLATGIGVGHRDSPDLPNVLRVTIFEEEDKIPARESLIELAANIDDMTPEHLSFLMEKLFEAGALDAWQESIVMKKNRLAVKVCALCRKNDAAKIKRCIFENSTTLGIREYEVFRDTLRRESFEKETPYGKVICKKSFLEDSELRIKAEFEDCRRISKEKNIAIDKVSKKLES